MALSPFSSSSGDLQNILNALNSLVVAIGNLNKTIVTQTGAIFPQTQGTATSATGGSAAALPAAPAGYLEFKLPSGATAKTPYYNV